MSGGVGNIALHVVKLVQNVSNQRLGKKMKGRENETVITSISTVESGLFVVTHQVYLSSCS